MDDWVNNSRTHSSVDRVIATEGGIYIAGADAEDYFRKFDPIKKEYSLRGEVVDAQALVGDINFLFLAIRKWTAAKELADRQRRSGNAGNQSPHT